MTPTPHTGTLFSMLPGFEPIELEVDPTAERIPSGTPFPDANDPTGTDGVYPRAWWAMGDTSLLQAIPAATTVTGARSCTPYGSDVARDYSERITERGGHVLTGLSYGIEQAAVRGVLAAGGSPIVVLPCGISRVFPFAHLDLAVAVLNAGGLVLSLTSDPAATPTRALFHRRSWWLGAITSRTLIVEAGARSSSLRTVAGAKATGALVGAVPGPVTSAASALPNSLLAERPKVHAVYNGESLTAFANAR